MSKVSLWITIPIVALATVALSSFAAPIVHNVGSSPEDSIALSVFCTDSIGNPIAADSFFVVVIGPSGDSIFSEAITTSSPRVDSSLMSGYVLYQYKAAVADIDRDGYNGAYSLTVTAKHNSPLFYNTFVQPFQITGWELSAAGDSAGAAARYGEDALDSLGRVIDSLYAVLDSIQAGVLVAGLTPNASASMWNVPFDYTFSAGAIGDSLSSRTYVQGEAASLDSATLVSWIWNTPQANHALTGTFGGYLDADISGLGTGSGLYSVRLTVYDETLEQTVPHSSVAIRNADQSAVIAVGNTGATGEIDFALDAGDYIVAAAAPGYLFPAYHDLSVTGVTDDTLIAEPFDPGSPVAPVLCRVYGFVRSVDGLPLEGASVSASLPATALFSTTVVSPQPVTATTDANGYFYFDLMPSSLLMPIDTRYDISISFNGRTFVHEQILIPATPTWQMVW